MRIGIATAEDLDTWTKVGEIEPLSPCDDNGLGAPGVIVLDGRMHLFFQGSGDNGRSYYLSRREIIWRDGVPHFTTA